MKLEKLFEPIKIGNLYLENRLKYSAMGTALIRNGEVSEELKSFYAKRAKRGVGITSVCMSPTRITKALFPYIYHDRFIPGLKELVKVFHDNGAKVCAQIIVGYAWTFPGRPTEFVSPSGISVTGKADPPFRAGGPELGTTTIRRALEEFEIAYEEEDQQLFKYHLFPF